VSVSAKVAWTSWSNSALSLGAVAASMHPS
jgi:hypothetical protein